MSTTSGHDMTHPDDIILNAYHDGELRGYARQAVDDHLDRCADCRLLLRTLASVDRSVQSLPQLHPPEALYTSIMARVEGKGLRHGSRMSLRLGVLIAALAAVLGGLLYAFHPTPGPQLALSVPTQRPATATHAAAMHPFQTLIRGSTTPQHKATTGTPVSPPTVSVGATLRSQIAAPLARTPIATTSVGSPLTNSQLPLPNTMATDGAATLATTGVVSLTVKEIPVAYKAIIAIAAQYQGQIVPPMNSRDSLTGTTLDLTMSVLPQQLSAVLNALGQLTHLQATVSSTQVDYARAQATAAAELQTLTLARDRVQSLLAQARTASTLNSLMSELDSLTRQIVQRQEQLSQYAAAVASAVITIHLRSAV